ncbi:DNA polymerase III subunit tau [Rubripirellula obstinata]|uniref:DNA polymerase III subunit gamma/tau n=1 Tax=Rubripirellula obstinata TaxID=406547 RepID=A0A5B1CIE5_9BACT|nr:DNA polymerase III subunit gamma/tau [Rubripirellula obstinata]KAA1259479.1 DNA polymerase III subunit tau [Rubripirellula obstinata]
MPSPSNSESDSGQASYDRDASSDGYVVVARRYRPKGFDELVGQEHVGQALKNAIETSRVGHAYLFTGARGVGKTSTARIFAKALNDPGGPTANPDPKSDVAEAIDSGEDVDVIEIDGASNRGIDEIRSLRANVGVRPSRSRFKIYIIDEVHMLTGAAFNALLKTLEEPPEHVKFIFCTTDPEKIPITVLSRCQRFDFAPVEVAKIVQRLTEIVACEGAQADEQALELIARRAAGSMRDSQSLLEQVLSFSDGKLSADSVHSMLGTADDARLHELATAMADRDSALSMKLIDSAIDAGVDAGRLAEQLLGYFRDLMAVTVGCEPSLLRHTSASMQSDLAELGRRWGLQTVLAVVGLVDQTLVRIRHSVYSRVLLEATLIQICNLPDLQNIADLAAASGQVRGKKPAAEKKKQPLSLDPPIAPAAAETMAAAPMVAKTMVVAESSSESDPPLAKNNGSAKPAATEPPEAVAASATLGDKTNLSQDQANALWKESLEQFEGMTATLARSVIAVEPLRPGHLRLVYPAEAGLAMRRSEAPENIGELTEKLSSAAGMPMSVEFHAAPPKPKPKVAEVVAKGPSKMQRMKDIETNPLIQACVKMLDAEIMRIDRPRG